MNEVEYNKTIIKELTRQLKADVRRRKELEDENKILRHENAQNRELIAWLAEKMQANGVLL